MNKEIRCIAITKEKWRRINGTVTPPPPPLRNGKSCNPSTFEYSVTFY